MGVSDMFDKAKRLAEEHGDKVDGALDKAADVVDEKTGGKYTDKIESGADAARRFLGSEEERGEEPPSRLEP
jgi:hypothetical protein